MISLRCGQYYNRGHVTYVRCRTMGENSEGVKPKELSARIASLPDILKSLRSGLAVVGSGNGSKHPSTLSASDRDGSKSGELSKRSETTPGLFRRRSPAWRVSSKR